VADSDSERAYLAYQEVIERLRAKRRRLVDESAAELEPVLNAYLGAFSGSCVEEAQELAKSVGEVLREFQIAFAGIQDSKVAPCALTVDFHSDNRNTPRYRLRFCTPCPSSDGKQRKYALIAGRTVSHSLATLLPLRLVPEQAYGL